MQSIYPAAVIAFVELSRTSEDDVVEFINTERVLELEQGAEAFELLEKHTGDSAAHTSRAS